MCIESGFGNWVDFMEKNILKIFGKTTTAPGYGTPIRGKKGKVSFPDQAESFEVFVRLREKENAPMSLGIDVESMLSYQIKQSYFPVIYDYNSPNSSLFSSQSPELESRTPFLKSYRRQFENLI